MFANQVSDEEVTESFRRSGEVHGRRRTYAELPWSLLADGRRAKCCRDMGCYSATLGPFCSGHAAYIVPEPERGE